MRICKLKKRKKRLHKKMLSKRPDTTFYITANEELAQKFLRSVGLPRKIIHITLPSSSDNIIKSYMRQHCDSVYSVIPYENSELNTVKRNMTIIDEVA